MYIFTKGKLISGVLVIGAIVIISGKTFFVQGETEDISRLSVAEDPVYLSTSTIPVRVSGVVDAAQSVVVYAQTAGVVTALPAQEGTEVTKGEVIIQQATPVEDAEAVLRTAEQILTNLQQAQLVQTEKIQLQQASARTYSASEIAALRIIGNDERITEQSQLLQNSLEQSVLSAITAVNYVHEHRSQFSAEGLELYETVVANLYGKVPSYFQGGVTRPVNSLYDIRDILSELQAEPVSSPVVLSGVVPVVSEQLRALETLFATAESDMFNQQSVFATAEDQASYLEERSKILTAQQSLYTVAASFSQTVDSVLEEKVSLETDITVTSLDEEIARIQAQYAEDISIQSERVARAGIGVAEAARALGRIEAPFAGVVARVHTEVGEYVTPGTPLVTLVGSGARELRVTVPAYMLSELSQGQEFVTDDGVAGFVDRFSLVTEGGSGMVVISLLPEMKGNTGSSLTGFISLSSPAERYRIPRRYLHFDSSGPFVYYETGEKSAVEVVYDTGTEVFVRAEKSLPSALVPAVSTSL